MNARRFRSLWPTALATVITIAVVIFVGIRVLTP